MKILLIIILLATNSYAGTLFSNTLYSTDTDDNVVISETVGVWLNKDETFDYGVSIGSRWFKNKDSQRLSLLFDKRFDKFGVYGDIGIESHGTIPSGDINIVRWHNYGQLSLHYEVDLIDSVGGLQNELYFQNVYVSSELVFKRLNLTLLGGNNFYSDGNEKRWIKFVGTTKIVGGLGLIGQAEYYEFSDNSLDFFSPEEYNRLLIGGYLNHSFDHLSFRSKFLYGTQTVIDETNESYYIQLTFRYPVDRIVFVLDMIWDKKQPEYRYDQYSLSIVYRF